MRLRSISILFAAVLLMTGCSQGSAGSGGTLEGPIWSLTSYVEDGTTMEVPDGVSADAIFDGANSTVAGSAGCNTYTGPYTADGSSLTFGQLATTLKMCEPVAGGVEAAYLANLAASRIFTASADTLTIYDGSGATLLTYAATDPAAIGDVTWHATGINNGNEAVASVVAGTDPTLVYDPAGSVSGSTGCNQYNGPATLDGISISIGPLVSTRMACLDDAASAQEAAFIAALENATTIERRGATLELRDDGGALQVGFAAD